MNKSIFVVVILMVTEEILAGYSMCGSRDEYENRIPLNAEEKDKLLGLWYITHVTSSIPASKWDAKLGPRVAPCQMHKFTLEEHSERKLLTLYSNNDAVSYSQPIVIYDSLDLENEFPVWAVKTDFNNYIAFITCDRYDNNRKQLKILSRTSSIKQDIVDEISSHLAKYGVGTDDFEAVSHDNC